MHGKSYPLVMGLLLFFFFFFNLNQKKTKIKILGTRLKCVGAKSQGATLNFIFRWMDTSAICILGTHRMSFIFCACTRIYIQFERSRVQQYDPFRHWFHHGLYVDLHVPGNILLHSLRGCLHDTGTTLISLVPSHSSTFVYMIPPQNVMPARVSWVHPGSRTGARISLRYQISCGIM